MVFDVTSPKLHSRSLRKVLRLVGACPDFQEGLQCDHICDGTFAFPII